MSAQQQGIARKLWYRCTLSSSFLVLYCVELKEVSLSIFNKKALINNRHFQFPEMVQLVRMVNKVACKVDALLSVGGLAVMQFSKDNQLPCYSSSYIVALLPHLHQCTVACWRFSHEEVFTCQTTDTGSSWVVWYGRRRRLFAFASEWPFFRKLASLLKHHPWNIFGYAWYFFFPWLP